MAEEKLSAAQRSKIRRLAQPKEMDEAEAGGELNIVPFLDIVMNVLMFVLATVSVTFTATIDTFPPRAGSGARAPTTPTLGLTVLIVPLAPEESTTFFRFNVQRSNDPRIVYEKGLQYLQSTYFQKPDLFSDALFQHH